MPEDAELKNDDENQTDENQTDTTPSMPEIYLDAENVDNQAIDPSQTSRIFLYKKEAPPETTTEAASKKLRLDGIAGINIKIKSVSGGKGQQDSSATPHSKKYEYVPGDARQITPEEKEKRHLEEVAKIKKIQKEETRKAMASKGSRDIVEKGILTKVIVAGAVILGLLTILLYFLKFK